MKLLTDENGMLQQTYFMDNGGHLYEWTATLQGWRLVPEPTAEQLAQFEAMCSATERARTELDQEARTLWSRFVNSRLMRPLFLRLEWLLDRFLQRKLYADAPELDDDDWDYGDEGVEVRHVPRRKLPAFDYAKWEDENVVDFVPPPEEKH